MNQMATGELPTSDGWCVPQLRIVLLGGRNSGKSSLGNLILGREEFLCTERTSCCRRLGAVVGRRLTVVDTPGWWCDLGARDTSELVKREIVGSVALCSPGPHVFLIAVKASSAFPEKRRRAVEEHVALLGEEVWGHCMLVFTGDTEPEPEPEPERAGGEALRWLAEKCGRRCHAVATRADVAGLLQKMHEVVAENGGRVFELQESISRASEEHKRSVEARAQQRLLRVKKHRSVLRERLRPVTDIRIVLLGAKGSGKTTTLNTILGRAGSQPLGRTAQCTVGRGVAFGRRLTAVDTPGWWMNYFCDESAAFDRRELLRGPSLCPPGPHAFLLLVRLDRAFTETYRRAAQEHLQLIGRHVWARVILLLSFGDWLGGTTAERWMESEGGPLSWLVERCGNRYHVLNNKTREDSFQVRELIRKVEEMLAGCSRHFEVDGDVMERMEDTMRREEERAKERLMKKEEQRQMAKTQLEKLRPLPELRIVLVGGRKTGKSSCGNTILGRELFNTDTQTACCAENRAQIGGKTVAVLDTPGCFSVTSDLLAPACALLLVVNVSSSFRESHEEALEKQLEAVAGAGGGTRPWSRAVVLFSHGDWLGDTSIERRIESEGGPLRRLVDRCENRYHVLDNRRRGCRAQVEELIELIEEALVKERLDALRRGDRVWKSVSSGAEQRPDAVTLRQRNRRHQLSQFSTCGWAALAPLHRSAEGYQIVALPAGRARPTTFTTLDGGSVMSCLASMLSGKHGPRWTLPAWFPADDLHLILGGERQLPRPKALLAAPQTAPAEGHIVSVTSLCHPALRERTLWRLGEAGGLQALIDRWDPSSLEELEAFIDSYFEMVWEQTMGSDAPTAEQHVAVEEAGEEDVLSSIDRKLSKLELLDEIRKDLGELRTNLESNWRAIEELREKISRDNNNT